MPASGRTRAGRPRIALFVEGSPGDFPREDYERFLGEKSKELSERLEEAKDVMKRLKDRS